MENQVNKLISDLLVLLIQSPLRFVKAMGYRLAVMPREITVTATKTMAVDGVTLFINPHWTLAQSKVKLLFVLLHEACHVWMLHPKRLRDVYPHQRDITHQAADYAVNLTLEQAGSPYPVPEDALINRDFVDHNRKCLNVERIVELLLNQQQEQEQEQEPGGQPGGNTGDSDDGQDSCENDTTESTGATGNDADDSGADDTDADADSTGGNNENADGGDSAADGDADADGDAGGVGSNSQNDGSNASTPESCGELLPAPQELDEQEHVKRNEQALQLSASGAGSMPSHMLDELHHQAQGSDTDWLAVFRDRFAVAVDASDWSEEKFNQQYQMIGMIEPTLYTEAIGTIAIVCDESSSMSNDALNRATEQIAAIVSEWTPQRVLVIRHTTEIVDVQDLSHGQEPEPREKRAHGGTYFNPVLQYLEYECVDVVCWVTDCYPCDDVQETTIPVIWLGTEYGSEWAHQRYNLQGDFVSIA